MLEAILAALHGSMQTIITIRFWAANWNKNEAVYELVKFIANAQKLKFCNIQLQINRQGIWLERQKAENGVSGFVKAIQQQTGKVICELETTLS